MTAGDEDLPAPPGTRRSTGRSFGFAADVIGHCVLVFAFAPSLAALPGWISFEADNPLNVEDAVVLMFLPVRGLVALLDTFAAGLGARVLTGAVAGVLLSAWLSTRVVAPTLARRILVGASSGALAAGLVTLGAGLATDFREMATAVGWGVVCGLVAASTAVHRPSEEPAPIVADGAV